MATTTLDKAIVLAQHELEAIRRGDVESAAQFYEKRDELMNLAMEIDDEENQENLRIKLIALQGYQQLLIDEGSELLQQIKDSIIRSKKYNKGAGSYTRTKHGAYT